MPMECGCDLPPAVDAPYRSDKGRASSHPWASPDHGGEWLRAPEVVY